MQFPDANPHIHSHSSSQAAAGKAGDGNLETAINKILDTATVLQEFSKRGEK
jgi:hypothetical protein